MSNDPAYYLAHRARELYGFSERATFTQLRRACRLRGILVHLDPEIDREGWYVDHPQCPLPVIILRRRSRWVLAHELFHAWIEENRTAGIAYAFSDYADDDVERAAERFACLLVGRFTERVQVVLGFER